MNTRKAKINLDKKSWLVSEEYFSDTRISFKKTALEIITLGKTIDEKFQLVTQDTMFCNGKFGDSGENCHIPDLKKVIPSGFIPENILTDTGLLIKSDSACISVFKLENYGQYTKKKIVYINSNYSGVATPGIKLYLHDDKDRISVVYNLKVIGVIGETILKDKRKSEIKAIIELM